MIEKLLALFFIKEYPHKNKQITLIKNRETTYVNFNRDNYVGKKQKKTDNSQTCLSKYFCNNKGLNVKERISSL